MATTSLAAFLKATQPPRHIRTFPELLPAPHPPRLHPDRLPPRLHQHQPGRARWAHPLQQTPAGWEGDPRSCRDGTAPPSALGVMPPPSHSSYIPMGDLEAFLHHLLTPPLGHLCAHLTGAEACRRVPIQDLPTYRDHHSTSSPWSPMTRHRGCSWPPAQIHQEPFAPTSCWTQPPAALPALGCLPHCEI